MVATGTLKENTSITERIEKGLTVFVEAIELSSNLEIIGTAFPNKDNGKPARSAGGCEEVFVIRNYNKAEGIEGAYVEVLISEIVQKSC